MVVDSGVFLRNMRVCGKSEKSGLKVVFALSEWIMSTRWNVLLICLIRLRVGRSGLFCKFDKV